MSEEDKIALRNSTAAIRCKFIVKAKGNLPEIILTDDNSIKTFEYDDDRLVPNEGFIGQFVARTLSGKLDNISDDFDINGREIQFYLGIVKLEKKVKYLKTENDELLITQDNAEIYLDNLSNADTSWYDFGTFIITEPEDDDVKDNTTFESMDYTKLFNKKFDGDYTDEEFTTSYNTYVGANLTDEERVEFIPTPVTAMWLAQYTCKQVGVEFGSLSFTNDDFEYDINPFQAGESCRDVMKQIGKTAFSWVRVGWDNKCYIDFGQQTTVDELDILDNDQYYSLTKSGEKVGPINKVAIGMSGIDGETAERIQDETLGDKPIYIYDNPLLYTFDLRLKALEKCDVLFGLEYEQLETETIGHPWFIGNELINVKDMLNNSSLTYPFNKKITYGGHIRSKISSVEETEVNKTLGYTSNIIKELRDASVNVNKQEGRINSLTKKITTIEDKFGDYYTIEQTNELLQDEMGLTNAYRTSGGANIFRNTGLWYRENNGFEYWDGPVDVNEDDISASNTVMLLQDGTLSQTVNNIPNGVYTISFKYEQLNPTATLQVLINNVDYTNQLINGSFGENGVQGNVTTNTISITFICDVNNGYKIYELMGNKGGAPILWTQYPNEVRTDTVNISKGITITSTTTNAVFKANADGIRIENSQKNTTTNFLDDGMETENATIKKQAKISGALHTIVGNQTWISGIL